MSWIKTNLRDFQIRRISRLAKRKVLKSDYAAAVRLLQIANRNLCSPEIETWLVSLRHEGFFHLEHASSREVWPPTISDMFHGTEGIPEISSEQLDATTVRAGVFTNGSIIVRNLLCQDDVELLRNGIIETYRSSSMAADGAQGGETMPWYVPFQQRDQDRVEELNRSWYQAGGAQLAADSPRSLFNLIESFEKNGIIKMVSEYLGERPALSVRKTSLREIPANLNTELGWHQDGAFLGDGIRTVNVWIALTDCGVDAPSMDMVPRRLPSIVPTGTEGAVFDWSISQKMLEEVCGENPPVHLNFKAGDAIIFDEMNLHRTSTSPSMTKSRFAIEAWFFAPSCFPLEQMPILV